MSLCQSSEELGYVSFEGPGVIGSHMALITLKLGKLRQNREMANNGSQKGASEKPCNTLVLSLSDERACFFADLDRTYLSAGKDDLKVPR